MSSQLARSDERSVPRGSSVAASAVFGLFTAVIGYLVTYVLVSSEVREAVGDNVAEWKGVAWYFYSAHLVDIEASGSVGPFGGTETVNLIAESSGSNAELLYVVPPLALLTTGAILAVWLHATDLGGAVLVGAPVAIGYAVVMGVGAVVAEAGTEGSIFGIETSSSIAPVFLPAVLLGGIVYPLVFATAGAVLAVVIR